MCNGLLGQRKVLGWLYSGPGPWGAAEDVYPWAGGDRLDMRRMPFFSFSWCMCSAVQDSRRLVHVCENC